MEEHRQRVSAAVNATTLQELHALVEDLQTAGPQLRAAPRQRFSPRAVVAALIGVLVVCVVVGWLAARNDDDDSATPSPAAAEPSHAMAAAPTPTPPMPEDPAPVVLAAPPDLLSAEGMARVVDEIRTRFGDTTGYELAITADRAMLAGPIPPTSNPS